VCSIDNVVHAGFIVKRTDLLCLTVLSCVPLIFRPLPALAASDGGNGRLIWPGKVKRTKAAKNRERRQKWQNIFWALLRDGAYHNITSSERTRNPKQNNNIFAHCSDCTHQTSPTYSARSERVGNNRKLEKNAFRSLPIALHQINLL
jgi:hypothetical protein